VVAATGPWSEGPEGLVRSYRCASWGIELACALAIGLLAEVRNHHPALLLEWRLLTVRLITHAEGTVTDLDRALAREIDDLLGVRDETA